MKTKYILLITFPLKQSKCQLYHVPADSQGCLCKGSWLHTERERQQQNEIIRAIIIIIQQILSDANQNTFVISVLLWLIQKLKITNILCYINVGQEDFSDS